MFEKLESAIMVLGEKLNNNKILMVLRDSFMLAFPLTIFGSIMLVIANFPCGCWEISERINRLTG